jgi:GT2 family glycosyltransferase
MEFSVIVPVFEHWHLIPQLLAGLDRQTIAREQVEVILVDNGSQQFVPPNPQPPNVKVLQCLTPGSYAARNHGVKVAQGTWLAFTDADCVPQPDWLAQFHQAIQAAEDGQTQPDLWVGQVAVVSQATRPNAYEIYDIVKGIPQERYVSRGYGATANLVVRRSVLEQLGGFDAQRFSGGDADFCRRAGAVGHRIAWVPGAVVQHPARRSWSEIATKARRLKGGQLAVGPLKRRFFWLGRTFLSPAITSFRFLSKPSQPLKFRVLAGLVALRVWFVELAEVVRLLGGQPAERR